jgi:hypothetical protein
MGKTSYKLLGGRVRPDDRRPGSARVGGGLQHTVLLHTVNINKAVQKCQFRFIAGLVPFLTVCQVGI